MKHLIILYFSLLLFACDSQPVLHQKMEKLSPQNKIWLVWCS